MYFSNSAGGQHQTNSPRRTSGGGLNESTSPIRKQFSQYMSLFQPDQTPGRHTPSDKIRKHHLRSSSSNPVNRMEMLYGSSSVTGGGSVTSLSPFHTASTAGVNNLVAVGTKTKSLSLLIDRSGGGLNGTGSETNYNYKRGGTASLDPRFASSVSGSYNRDQSLERNSNKPREYFTIGSRWDRASADREYSFPYTGNARSLEREQQMRAQSFEGSSFYRDQETPSPAFFPNESSIPSRDSYVLDLQAQIAELNKECAVLQQELDLAKEKLNSTMNSIKSFWSPELKKERSLRKEENLKYSTLSEQLKAVEIENRQHLTALMKLEQENRTMRETCTNSSNTSTNMQTQQQSSSLLSSSFATHSTGTGVGESGPSAELIILKKEKDKHLKEMKLLRKTLDEMELRIETQQKTLNTRDETIKKLMDMFQQARAKGAFVSESVGPSVNEGKSNIESSINRRLELDLSHAREDLKKLREEADLRIHQLDNSRGQEKLLRDKLETQKQELARKESEMSALQSRIDTLQRHFNDHEKHITVLREQITSKEQQIKMLHLDVEMLQDRLKEREETMDRKVRQITQLQNDKTRLNIEMSSMRDELDESNSKVTSQQRKLESMEESVKEKELQLNSTKIQLSSLQLDHTSSDKALESLRDMMADKDRQIEKLREQKEKIQRDMETEVKATMGRSADLKVKITQLQDDIISLQGNELILREEMGRLKAELGTKDALLSKLSFEENELQAIVEDLQCKLSKSKREVLDVMECSQSEADVRLNAAQAEIEASRQEVSKARMELAKMAATKSELESQVKEKSSRLNDLETQMLIMRRDYEDVGEGEKDNEAKRRRSDDDVIVFKSILDEKDNRIEELEGALKESIKITAQREVVMAEQQMKLEHTERLMESMQEELENSKRLLEDGREQLLKSNQQVKEKDDVLREHFNDSKKQLSEVYEMKQEAILAAISEKDAHIALLEMAPNKRTENIQEVEKLSKEKLKLQQVLRELTQSRMKLLQSRGHMRSSSASSLLHYATHRDAVMQKVDFGTYFVYHNELLAEDDDGPHY